jgi:hypothetical protein
MMFYKFEQGSLTIFSKAVRNIDAPKYFSATSLNWIH